MLIYRLLENRYSTKIFLIISAIFFFYSLLFAKTHGWDIDSFLYLGSRLWKGELLYIHDFETKLPFVQYLFAIPSALGGIGAWRIINLGICSVLAWQASVIAAKQVGEHTPSCKQKSRRTRNLLFSVFIATLYAMPDAISAHLEMIAASAAFLSLTLLLQKPNVNSMQNNLVSGILIGVALCLRPNYAFVMPAFLWYLYTQNRDQKKQAHTSSSFLLNVSMFLSGAAIVVAVTLSPYLTNATYFSALLDSFTAISRYPQTGGVADTLIAQFQPRTAVFYAGLYSACSVMLVALWRGTKLCSYTRRRCTIILVSIGCLNISFITTHYWDHNAIIFTPYICLILILSANKSLLNDQLFDKISFVVALGTVALMISLQAGIILSKFLTNEVDVNLNINDRNIDHQLLNYISESRKSFYVIDNPIYHALLGETRIGDGHPAMIRAVFQGREIGPIGSLPLYKSDSSVSPCQVLNQSTKTLLIAKKPIFAKFLDSCANESGAKYEKIYPSGLEESYIFEKKSPNALREINSVK